MSFPISSPVDVNGSNAEPGRINLRTTDYTLTIEAPSLSSDVMFRFPSEQGTSGQVLRTDGVGNSTWIDKADTLVAFNLCQGGIPIAISLLTFSSLCNFVFRGTTDQVFSKCMAVVQTGALTTGELELRDVNAGVVGTTTFGPFASKTIVEFDFTPPVSQTILELRMRVSSGLLTVSVYSFHLCRP